ncbi:C40 family peptidase OS=Streptomyces tendae OX=1932 GN=GUR47_17845 PE=3 SV=1 [Streptomyces tendae]
MQAQVGKAYVSGATGPSAYDCSGLVQAAFKQVGISLPRVSQAQSTAGTQVGLDNLQPGDILYWGGAGSAYHVGVYVGGGMFVGAQNSSTGVVEKPLSYDPPSGAVRVL